MIWHDPPKQLSDEELRKLSLDQQLHILRQLHATLGEAYRSACEELIRLRKESEDYRSAYAELKRLRKEHEDYRARLHAIRVLCGEPAP